LIKHNEVLKAVATLDHGGLIAYPTEAVWGLGCDPLNQQAVMNLLKLKQRPIEKGLILVADSLEACIDWFAPLSEQQYLLLEKSWPGFKTWVIPAACWVPFWIKGIHSGLALRVSKHSLIRKLCEAFGGPVISTSANHYGLPPIRNQWQLRRAFGHQLDFVLTGRLGAEQNPSPIFDLLSEKQLR
jgi:L-threonylcarbamoyladenylate synthase